MTSHDLHAAVQNSFPKPNYVYLKEVRDATGFDSVRSADALAIGMYRSCGRLIHGFEMKVSRSDWLRELKDASKAESIMRYCHRWAVIVPDASIVHEGELPAAWGLGVPHQSRKNAIVKIQWIVKPPELTPQPPSMIFLSALIYSAQRADKHVREKEANDNHALGFKAGQEDFKRRSGDVGKLKELVVAFEKASGVEISKYDSEASVIAKGVAFNEWRRAGASVEQHRKALQRLKEEAERALAGIKHALAPLECSIDPEAGS